MSSRWRLKKRNRPYCEMIPCRIQHSGCHWSQCERTPVLISCSQKCSPNKNARVLHSSLSCKCGCDPDLTCWRLQAPCRFGDLLFYMIFHYTTLTVIGASVSPDNDRWNKIRPLFLRQRQWWWGKTRGTRRRVAERGIGKGTGAKQMYGGVKGCSKIEKVGGSTRDLWEENQLLSNRHWLHLLNVKCISI